jgi:hypothetical protein
MDGGREGGREKGRREKARVNGYGKQESRRRIVR